MDMRISPGITLVYWISSQNCKKTANRNYLQTFKRTMTLTTKLSDDEKKKEKVLKHRLSLRIMKKRDLAFIKK
jgi:hypothetical protein